MTAWKVYGIACKNAGKYSRREKILSPCGFNTVGASASVAPAVPTPLTHKM